MSDMWVDPQDDPRAEEGMTRGERDTLFGPWREVRHGLTGAGQEYASGLDGVMDRLRGTP